jgi:yeast amino acid transporter
MNQSDSITPVAHVREKNSSTEDVSDHSSQDAEKYGVTRAPELKRKLKSRHLQMIAIGMLVSV